VTTAGDLEAWLTLMLAPGLGPVEACALSNAFGGPGQVLRAGGEALAGAGVGEAARRALKTPNTEAVAAALAWLDGPGRAAVTIDDAAYPALLRCIPDPPPVLFMRGRLECLAAPALAVVGSRHPTRPGAETARSFARALAAEGLVVVSGLAEGIDAAAHRGAMDAAGATVAVAGHGLDTVYPPRHRDLAARIAEEGLLVSEFLPGTPPRREHFPRRNRIISGVALGVLVVEAAVRSGSLITARLAGEQGREVFAIPGSIHNPMARGCHRLIRQGAKLVETVADLLEELGWAPGGSLAPALREDVAPAAPELDGDYITLLEAMGYDPATVDQLVQRTGLTPQALSSMLLVLELRGIVHPVPGAGYVRAVARK
jgi:DNA processing protein